MLISIIVPVYNIENYISRCMDSVLSQTHKDLEVITVNDGSTDHSPDILDKYAIKDSRVKVIHKENGGVTSARMRGIREAHGEWIGFVDGDDYVEPDMFEKLLNNALQYNAQISHCGYQMVFPSRVDYYYNTGRIVQQSNREALKDLLVGSYEPCLCNKLFHNSLFHKLLQEDLLDQSIRINEDLLMNFYLFNEAEQTVFEDICPYHYMVRKGSAATSKVKPYKLRDPGRVRRILMEETNNDPELYAFCLQSYIILLTRISTKSLHRQTKEIKDCIYEARHELRVWLPKAKQIHACSNRQAFLSTWAAVWPGSYHVVRHLYGEVSGANHKYDIK